MVVTFILHWIVHNTQKDNILRRFIVLFRHLLPDFKRTGGSVRLVRRRKQWNAGVALLGRCASQKMCRKAKLLSVLKWNTVESRRRCFPVFDAYGRSDCNRSTKRERRRQKITSSNVLCQDLFETLFSWWPAIRLFELPPGAVREWWFRSQLDRFALLHGAVFCFLYLVLRRWRIANAFLLAFLHSWLWSFCKKHFRHYRMIHLFNHLSRSQPSGPFLFPIYVHAAVVVVATNIEASNASICKWHYLVLFR